MSFIVNLLPSELGLLAKFAQYSCSETVFFLKGMVINNTTRFGILVDYAIRESQFQNRMQIYDNGDFQALYRVQNNAF